MRQIGLTLWFVIMIGCGEEEKISMCRKVCENTIEDLTTPNLDRQCQEPQWDEPISCERCVDLFRKLYELEFTPGNYPCDEDGSYDERFR